VTSTRSATGCVSSTVIVPEALRATNSPASTATSAPASGACDITPQPASSGTPPIRSTWPRTSAPRCTTAMPPGLVLNAGTVHTTAGAAARPRTSVVLSESNTPGVTFVGVTVVDRRSLVTTPPRSIVAGHVTSSCSTLHIPAR
jgi:hypothetical protein